MIRLRALPLLAAVVLFTGCSSGRYGYDVSLDISSAPPGPRFVFDDRPAYLAEYSGGVYVVDAGIYNVDMFRYGSYWYVYSNNYWYRARDYNGPYVVIDFDIVPSRIMRVPESRWRHYPEYRRHRHRNYDYSDRDRDRDRDRYRDRDRDRDRDDGY